VTAAYDAVIAPLNDKERGLVNKAGEEAQQIVDVAGPLVRLTDVPEEVNEACTWLQKDPPPYLDEFPDQPAALAFCAQLLAQTPLLMMHIRDRTRRVSLATVALATGATGIYVVDTTVKTERAEALHRGEAGEVPSRVCRVVAIKLKNAPRAETLEFLYAGQSVDNARRMVEHDDPNSTQFCDEAARCLETTCGGATTVHELATVGAVAMLAGQAGLTAADGLNLAEAVVAHVLQTMTAEGNLNVAKCGCVGVAASVSAAGGRLTSGARGRYRFGEQTKPWFRLNQMTCLAAHAIAERCTCLAFDEARVVAKTLPLGALCKKYGDSQLLDIAGRLGVGDTDAIGVLQSMIGYKAGSCPSHATRGRSGARARGILHAERPDPSIPTVYVCECL
jgi:hypothetical protein